MMPPTRQYPLPPRKTSEENSFSAGLGRQAWGLECTMTGVVIVVQGWELSDEDIRLIQGLLAEYRDRGRTRLGEALCRWWDWRNARGRIKKVWSPARIC